MILSTRPRRDLTVRLSQTETRLKVLMRRFGYRVCGDRILEIGEGCQRDTVFGRCRSTRDAAKQLLAVIADDTYASDFWSIVTP